MTKFGVKAYVLAALLCLASCSKGELPGASSKEGGKAGQLLEAVPVTEISLANVCHSCVNIPDSLLLYGVDVYRIKYLTRYQCGSQFHSEDELVEAEALMLCPSDCGKIRFALYCHGTNVPLAIGDNTKSFYLYDGPGRGRDYQEIVDITLPLASAGYSIVFPEYTGYGSTWGREHCFVYYPELCKSTVDALFAARDFLKGEYSEDPGKDLWLCGWSQGGAASFTTELILQRDYPGEFNVVANSCMSGPYNMLHYIRNLFLKPNKQSLTMALYAWAAYELNYFSPQLMRPSDQIFNLPVYHQVNSVFIGNGSPNEVFRPYYIEGVNSGRDSLLIKALLEDSCVLGEEENVKESLRRSWPYAGIVPKSKMWLHFGTEDSLVPYFNTVDAYNYLTKMGKTDVDTVKYEGKGHFDFVPEYTIATIGEFKTTLQ